MLTPINSALAEYDNNVIKANYYDKSDTNALLNERILLPQIITRSKFLYNSNRFSYNTAESYINLPFTINNASKRKVCIALLYVRVALGTDVSVALDLPNATSIYMGGADVSASYACELFGTYNQTDDTWVCTSISNQDGIGTPLHIIFI